MRILFIAFSLILSMPFWAQERVQISLLSTVDSPFKVKTPYMNSSIGVGYELSYKLFEALPMYLDFENTFSYNSRLHFNRSRTIYFDNLLPFTHNYSANYTTHLNKFLIGTKWVIGNDYRDYNVFITPQVGFMNFNATLSYDDVDHPYWSNSRYNDYDQDDVQFHSHRDKFFRSNVFVFGGSTGVSFNMNDFFGLNSKVRQRLFLRGSFYMSMPKKFSYTNMNYVLDQNNSNSIIDQRLEYRTLPNNSNVNEIGQYPILVNQLMLWGIQIGYTFVF